MPGLRGHNDHAANAAIGIGVPYDCLAALLAGGPVPLPGEALTRWGLALDNPASLTSEATNAWLVARLLREHLEANRGNERDAFVQTLAALGQARSLADSLRPTRWARVKEWVRGLL